MNPVLVSALLYWVSLVSPCAHVTELTVEVEYRTREHELTESRDPVVTAYRIDKYRAVAGGRTYELAEPTYLPHGGTFVHSFWIDGERAHPAINVEQMKTTGEAPTPRRCYRP